jgi:hypothetical protein
MGGSPWRPAAVKYSSGGCAPVSGWAVSGDSERYRSGGLWSLNDGKHGDAVAVKAAEEEEGSLHGRGGAPFIAGGGSWQRLSELRPGQWWW